VYHDPGVGQRVSHSWSTGREQEGSHGTGLTHTPSRYRWLDVLHRIVDGEARCHNAARRVDVQMDRLVDVLRLQE